MSIFKRFISRKKENLPEEEAKRQKIFLKVKEILVKELKIENTSKIQLTTNLQEDLGVDSLNTVELVMAFEV